MRVPLGPLVPGTVYDGWYVLQHVDPRLTLALSPAPNPNPQPLTTPNP